MSESKGPYETSGRSIRGHGDGKYRRITVYPPFGEPPGSADKIYEKAFGVYPFGDES